MVFTCNSRHSLNSPWDSSFNARNLVGSRGDRKTGRSLSTCRRSFIFDVSLLQPTPMRGQALQPRFRGQSVKYMRACHRKRLLSLAVH